MTRAQKISEVEQQLVEVKAAISRIVTDGQAYGAEGRTMQRANLTDLEARQQKLEAKLSKLRRGHTISTYGVVF